MIKVFFLRFVKWNQNSDKIIWTRVSDSRAEASVLYIKIETDKESLLRNRKEHFSSCRHFFLQTLQSRFRKKKSKLLNFRLFSFETQKLLAFQILIILFYWDINCNIFLMYWVRSLYNFKAHRLGYLVWYISSLTVPENKDLNRQTDRRRTIIFNGSIFSYKVRNL